MMNILVLKIQLQKYLERYSNMDNIYQDLTVTICLNEMTPEEYRKRINQIRGMSLDELNFYTYTDNDKGLTQEQKDYLETLK